MKIISWNVAGIRACIKKGFIDFFNEINADIFCVQEVKALKEKRGIHYFTLCRHNASLTAKAGLY